MSRYVQLTTLVLACTTHKIVELARSLQHSILETGWEGNDTTSVA